MSEYNSVVVYDCEYKTDYVEVNWEDNCTDGLPLGVTVVEAGTLTNVTLNEEGLDKLIETLQTIKKGLVSE